MQGDRKGREVSVQLTIVSTTHLLKRLISASERGSYMDPAGLLVALQKTG